MREQSPRGRGHGARSRPITEVSPILAVVDAVALLDPVRVVCRDTCCGGSIGGHEGEGELPIGRRQLPFARRRPVRNGGSLARTYDTHIPAGSGPTLTHRVLFMMCLLPRTWRDNDTL